MLAGVTIPGWFELVVLTVAAFRTWHLLSEDKIGDRPRRWALRLGDWQPATKGPDPAPPKEYRERLADFITCPWCCGNWVLIGWWGAFELSPHLTTMVAVPVAMCAGVPLLAIVFSRLAP